MVKIRLRRVGAKKQPHYRVVVAESSSPRDGKFIETIGHYNPRTEPSTVVIDAERALYWLSVGAQPSEAVKRMLDKLGIMSQVTAVRQGEVSIEEIVSKIDAEKLKSAPKAVKKVELEEVLELEDEEEALDDEETPDEEVEESTELEVAEADDVDEDEPEYDAE